MISCTVFQHWDAIVQPFLPFYVTLDLLRERAAKARLMETSFHRHEVDVRAVWLSCCLSPPEGMPRRRRCIAC